LHSVAKQEPASQLDETDRRQKKEQIVMNTHRTILENASTEATISDRILQTALAAWKPEVEAAADSKNMATFDQEHRAPFRIVSRQLTTCSVIEGGKTICFDFVRQAGESVSIEMPFDQAESIVMTVPRLLSAALKMQTGDAQARYVFSVGNWSLELAKDQNYRILAVRTPDGFEVAFAISLRHPWQWDRR
jgi:hypothetical protein